MKSATLEFKEIKFWRW